jgi:hypothetical protein
LGSKKEQKMGSVFFVFLCGSLRENKISVGGETPDGGIKKTARFRVSSQVP